MRSRGYVTKIISPLIAQSLAIAAPVATAVAAMGNDLRTNHQGAKYGEKGGTGAV
jgi:hypothetical protein